MDLTRHLRRQLKSSVAPMIGLSLSLYFGYNLVEGDRGLIAWVRKTEQLRSAKQAAAKLQGERETLEKRVSLLRSDHLDPDLLDEQARAALNLVGPDEIIILNGEPAK
jgi:cell division protein FtsB